MKDLLGRTSPLRRFYGDEQVLFPGSPTLPLGLSANGLQAALDAGVLWIYAAQVRRRRRVARSSHHDSTITGLSFDCQAAQDHRYNIYSHRNVHVILCMFTKCTEFVQ